MDCSICKKHIYVTAPGIESFGVSCVNGEEKAYHLRCQRDEKHSDKALDKDEEIEEY